MEDSDRQLLVHNLLTELARSDEEEQVDAWLYFLMSGMAFGYLEESEDVGLGAVEKLAEVLGATEDENAEFTDAEIGDAAITIFEKVKDVPIDHVDLAEAFLRDAAYMAKFYDEKGLVSVDSAWTCFETGWKSRYLAGVSLTRVDPVSMEECKYGPWKN